MQNMLCKFKNIQNVRGRDVPRRGGARKERNRQNMGLQTGGKGLTEKTLEQGPGAAETSQADILGKSSRKRNIKGKIPDVGESTFPDVRRPTCLRQGKPEGARGR